MCLGSLPQGLETTCGLLSLLGTSIFGQSTMTVTAMKRHVTSVLDQHQRLWNVIVEVLDHSSSFGRQLSRLVERVFQVLQDLVLNLSQPQWQSSVRQKAHSLWAQCIAGLFCVSQASSFKAMAHEIISLLAITKEVSLRAPELTSAVCETLQPTTKAVMTEKIVQPVIFTKIQVRYYHHEIAV